MAFQLERPLAAKREQRSDKDEEMVIGRLMLLGAVLFFAFRAFSGV